MELGRRLAGQSQWRRFFIFTSVAKKNCNFSSQFWILFCNFLKQIFIKLSNELHENGNFDKAQSGYWIFEVIQPNYQVFSKLLAGLRNPVRAFGTMPLSPASLSHLGQQSVWLDLRQKNSTQSYQKSQTERVARRFRKLWTATAIKGQSPQHIYFGRVDFCHKIE